MEFDALRYLDKCLSGSGSDEDEETPIISTRFRSRPFLQNSNTPGIYCPKTQNMTYTSRKCENAAEIYSSSANIPPHVPIIKKSNKSMPKSYPKQATNDNTNNTLINTKSSVSLLPDKFQSIFKFNHFNAMQSKCFDGIYNSDENYVISSPTGSGKTVLFELAILRQSMLVSKQPSSGFKALYLAPTKALCEERCNDWTRRFSALNLTCGVLTSDTTVGEADRVKKSDIIITTPEKLDVITRRWRDYGRLFDLVKLFLIDEIHMIRDRRGATLEVVVARMKTICSKIRFIALSATVPNIEDVARWIGRSQTSNHPAWVEVFGEEYRSVQLQRHVLGYQSNYNNDFQFDVFLSSKVVEVLKKYSKGKPVILFCPTRNIAISTAKHIAKNCLEIWQKRKPLIGSVKQKDLLSIMESGVSFHHAGLTFEDRKSVEQNFIHGSTKVICSTSTLSVGVNLPAYLVIIKGTRTWNEGAFREYSELEILQMIGRAGRPQFENEGIAVILTRLENKNLYERLIKGTEKLESCLHENLLNHLAAEISLKTIYSSETASDWLKSTFFFTRFRTNPSAYQVDGLNYASDIDMDTLIRQFCDKKMKELLEAKIIDLVDRKYISTIYGEAMSRYYISFQTMNSIIQLKNALSIGDLLLSIGDATEFGNVKLKRHERRLFKQINKSSAIKYPIKQDVKSDRDKISIIIQYELGGLDFPSYEGASKLYTAFNADKYFVFKQLQRILRCMIDCFVEKKDYISLVNCLEINRSTSGRCWENSSMVLRQLTGVGLAYLRKFASHNILSFSDLRNIDVSKIEYYLGLTHGRGAKIFESLMSLPSLKLEGRITSQRFIKPQKHIKVSFEISVSCENVGNLKKHKQNTSCVVACGLSTGELIDFRRAPLSKLEISKILCFTSIITAEIQSIECQIHCEELAGVGQKVSLKPEIDSDIASLLLVQGNHKKKVSCGQQSLDDFDVLIDDPALEEIVDSLNPPQAQVKKKRKGNLRSERPNKRSTAGTNKNSRRQKITVPNIDIKGKNNTNSIDDDELSQEKEAIEKEQSQNISIISSKHRNSTPQISRSGNKEDPPLFIQIVQETEDHDSFSSNLDFDASLYFHTLNSGSKKLMDKDNSPNQVVHTIVNIDEDPNPTLAIPDGKVLSVADYDFESNSFRTENTNSISKQYLPESSKTSVIFDQEDMNIEKHKNLNSPRQDILLDFLGSDIEIL